MIVFFIRISPVFMLHIAKILSESIRKGTFKWYGTFHSTARVYISKLISLYKLRGLLFSDNVVFFSWGEYLHSNSIGMTVVDATFYSLLLSLHWAAVLRHPSCSDHLGPFLWLSGGQAGRLCGSELPTQSGWWMELQYLFRRLFLKPQFHSTVPVWPASLCPRGYPSWSPACMLDSLLLYLPVDSWNWWLATRSTEAGSEHGSRMSV